MASLSVKGYFDWELNDQNALRLGVNLNGANGTPSSPQFGVIMVEDQTGSIVNMTNAGVNTNQQTLIAAYNAMYNRRRTAWVKLRFFPKYSEFPTQVDSTGDIIAAQNVPLYTVTDMRTLDTEWYSLVKSGILANNTGVKVKLAHKQFKIFRKAIKYPPYPKYAPLISQSSLSNEAVAGTWLNASTFATNTDADSVKGQIAAFADFDGQAFNAGEIMYEVQFEIKYVWCDRESDN